MPTMDLDATYEELRPLLFSIAYRMTGSVGDAEDRDELPPDRGARAAPRRGAPPALRDVALPTDQRLRSLARVRHQRGRGLYPRVHEPSLLARVLEPLAR